MGDERLDEELVSLAGSDPDAFEELYRRTGELEVIVRPAVLVERFGHLGPPSMSLDLHDAAEPACTPELAARW